MLKNVSANCAHEEAEGLPGSSLKLLSLIQIGQRVSVKISFQLLQLSLNLI